MNKEFLMAFMKNTSFPEQAVQYLTQAMEQVPEEGLDEIVSFYCANDYSWKMTRPYMIALAEQCGLSPYTVKLFVLMETAGRVRPQLEQKGISGQLYWDTFEDLRYKLQECYAVYGVWGTFVGFWYDRFFRGDLVKLGRLEYENSPYPLEEPYVWGDRVVKKGDTVRELHIPSSGESFDLESRLDSYRKAKNFFGDEPLFCFCDSWLLYPVYRELFAEGSNTRSFMGDFHIVEQAEQESFQDAWRIFGADAGKAPADLPEKTSMQRAFKQHLLKGGSVGCGVGVLIFDENGLRTRK